MTIPATLKQALKDRSLVPFVGAGLSMTVLQKDSDQALFPNWKQLLLGAAAKLDAEGDVNSAGLIKANLEYGEDDSYLRAAQIAEKKLGKNSWNNFLIEKFAVKKERCESYSLSTAEKVWQLGSPLIITTNYDKVLDWSCPTELRDDLQHWNIEASHEQLQAITNSVTHPTVWHLHGRIDTVNKLILAPDGYKTLYGDGVDEEDYKAALTSLRIFLATRTLLFIGFSCDDEDFLDQIKHMHDIFEGGTPKHYVLVRKSQAQKIKRLKLPLHPVTYDNYEDLPALLDELASYVDSPDSAESEKEEPREPTPTARFSLDNFVFSVPFRAKGDGVVGRENSLLALREQLLNGTPTNIGHAAAFRGMGGLGKTQLAVEYAHRYKDTYPKGVIWLTADQEISSQLIHTATKADWISSHSERELILNTAIKRIKTYSDCLIIFDNVDDLAQIKDYLPEVDANPHLLITSRTDQPGFTPIQLELLSGDESLILLFKEANREQTKSELEAAQKIVDALDHLPLAIEIAGAYLKHLSTMSMARYVQLLESNLKLAMSGKYFAGFTKHEKDLYLTLNITDSEVSQAPLLKEILLLLSWSAPASMGLSLMTELLGVEEVELFEPLELGVGLKLLTADDNNERYSVHRLLRQIQRDTLPVDEKGDWAETICERMIRWFKDRKDDFTDLAEFEAEKDHLESWAALAEKNIWSQCSGLIWLQAYPSWHWGRYQVAGRLLHRALTIQQDTQFHSYELTKADITADIGSINNANGQYNDALKYNETALTLRIQLHGENHPDTAQSYHNTSCLYYELDQQQKALELDQKALSIRLGLYGENHVSVASSYNNIGNSYCKIGRYKEALEFQKKSLSIWHNLYLDNHPDVANNYSSIGGTYKYIGHNQTALKFHEKGLLIRIELFGDNHPDVANSYWNVSKALSDLTQHKKSLVAQQKALQIYLSTLGTEHPNTIGSVWSMLNRLIALNHFKEASNEVYQFEKLLPANHQQKETLDNMRAHINQKSTKAGFHTNRPKSGGKKKVRKKTAKKKR
ncbi:MAG: tetratricopeptide repeat protein [Algicola sp.]|nr:tetratricopeptide repeat protein [Algicola sp.]